MEPPQFFIADLAGKLVKSYWLDPEGAQAGLVEVERRNEIDEAMRLGYGYLLSR